MRTSAIAIAIAIVLAVVTGTSTREAAAFEAVTLADYSGAELFERFCASCHGERARGDGPVARSLNVAVPDLTSISLRYGTFPAMRVRDVIDGRGIDTTAHGTRTMPVWGYEFWVDEGGDIAAQRAVRDAINRLVDYVRSLQQSEPQLRNGRAATAGQFAARFDGFSIGSNDLTQLVLGIDRDSARSRNSSTRALQLRRAAPAERGVSQSARGSLGGGADAGRSPCPPCVEPGSRSRLGGRPRTRH